MNTVCILNWVFGWCCDEFCLFVCVCATNTKGLILFLWGGDSIDMFLLIHANSKCTPSVELYILYFNSTLYLEYSWVELPDHQEQIKVEPLWLNLSWTSASFTWSDWSQGEIWVYMTHISPFSCGFISLDTDKWWVGVCHCDVNLRLKSSCDWAGEAVWMDLQFSELWIWTQQSAALFAFECFSFSQRGVIQSERGRRFGYRKQYIFTLCRLIQVTTEGKVVHFNVQDTFIDFPLLRNRFVAYLCN